jgi:hypothetical protein
MNSILSKIEKFAKEQTNKFIIYILIIACVGFYLGFVYGRSFAALP